MGKYALLIGISEYPQGLVPLPAATRDVAAMERVLRNPELGNFDNVECLLNPRQSDMAQRIERWFGERQEDDLALLFFSGHGVKDERRKLYFAASNTEKVGGKLIRSTALAASNVHDFIRFGRCKQQVVILDCCFSGAFGDVLLAKDDGEIALDEQLGAEGRVVLASTSSVDYSFEEKDSGLSIYTRYLIEGIEKGAADTGGDGWISVDELHQFASGKVREAAPAMSPKIIMLKDEGYRIVLARSPQDKPEVKYRRATEGCASKGHFSKPARRLLTSLRKECGLSEEEALSIENEVLQPFREYSQKIEEYRKALVEAVEDESVLSQATISDLNRYQKYLGLRDQDIKDIRSSLPGHISALLEQNENSLGETLPPNKKYTFSQKPSSQSISISSQGKTLETGGDSHTSSRGRQNSAEITDRDEHSEDLKAPKVVEKGEDNYAHWRIPPDKYLKISGIITLVCFPFFFMGLSSILCSVQMKKMKDSGNYKGAERNARGARILWVGAIVPTIVLIVVFSYHTLTL